MSTSSSGASGKDNVFDLGSSAFASDHFRMYEFKVKRCPRARPHDWTQCPFAHPGEKARRRDPRRYRYSGTACPEFRKSGCCRRGDACPFAHGVFECWLHPSRYRTQLCTDGGSCKRRVCFFAHCETELRKPEDDPVSAERQVQAELAAGSSNHLKDALGQQNNNEHINYTKTNGLPESTNINGGAGVNTANPFAQEVQVLQQQHLAQALQTIFNASGVANTTGGSPSATQSDVALELLKQITTPQSATALPTPDSAGGSNTTNTLVALLQQLLMQSSQPEQQQQPQQPQQQQTTKTKPASAEVSEAPALQDASTDGAQANLQTTLKNILQHQQSLPVSSATETPPVSMATTPPQFLPGGTNGLGVDPSQLAQLDPSVLNGLLEQNSASRSRAPPASDRQSIDNNLLAAKILGMSGQVDSDPMAQGSMMVPTQSQAQNPQPQAAPNGFAQLQGQPDARHMLSIGGMHTGHYLTNNLQNVAGTVHGIPFDQNPGLSSQLMQLDPAILNSLAMRARQTAGTSPGVIDNGFLARLSNVDLSGIVNGVAAQPENLGLHMIAPGVPVQNGGDIQAGLLQNIQNSLLASQMQGLLHGLGHTDTAMHFPQMNAMASFEKNTHHERMGSGNESSLMMPSNMLQ